MSLSSFSILIQTRIHLELHNFAGSAPQPTSSRKGRDFMSRQAARERKEISAVDGELSTVGGSTIHE